MTPRPAPSPPGGPPVSNASALLQNDAGACLLHLRDNLPGIREPGFRALPGGGREPGDRSLAETARRELREETALDLPGLEPFAVETATGIDGSPVLIQIFTARRNGDPATLHLTEGLLLHWFRPEAMPRPRLAPSTLELVHRHAELSAPTGWPVSPREPPAGATGADPPGRRPRPAEDERKARRQVAQSGPLGVGRCAASGADAQCGLVGERGGVRRPGGPLQRGAGRREGLGGRSGGRRQVCGQVEVARGPFAYVRREVVTGGQYRVLGAAAEGGVGEFGGPAGRGTDPGNSSMSVRWSLVWAHASRAFRVPTFTFRTCHGVRARRRRVSSPSERR